MEIAGNNLSCAILQPHYLPWIGYFEMIDRVDLFVFLDDVQFIKREWKNRNRIRKTFNGNDTKWLTVPIIKKFQKGFIKDAMISNESNWAYDHFQSIYYVYAHTPYFDKYFVLLKEIIEQKRDSNLSKLNISLVRLICKDLGIDTKLLMSSELNICGKREERLLNVCKAINADLYLANNATGEYVNADYFQNHGIKFVLQDYQHPVYEQTYKGKKLPFLSHLSIIDLLFNHGPGSLNIMRKGNADNKH